VKLNIRAKFSTEKRLFPENAHPHVIIARPTDFGRLGPEEIPQPVRARFSLNKGGFSGFL